MCAGGKIMLERKFNIPLYVIASILFGAKTYIIYRFMVDIMVDNPLQEFILFINPFISAFLFFGLSVWFKKSKNQVRFIRYSIIFGTIVIFSNLVFYRAYTDFITIPQLFQMSNASDLGSSVSALLKAYDVLFFVDIIIVWYLSKREYTGMTTHFNRKGKVATLATCFVLLLGNFTLSGIESPDMFKRNYDRPIFVKNIGLFNHHIVDVLLYSKERTQRVFADGNELPEITDYLEKELRSDETSELFGFAEDRNIIFISAESVQNFVINNTVNGEEITPFLNELINDESSYYFENFYHQTEQGKTSDSEFITENSLYPASRGAVFFTHDQNDYNAMPEMLEKKDYYTAVFHANNKSFWNRDSIYEKLHIDDYYDKEAYEITDDNTVGWGLKDKPYFEQSMKYLQAIEQPFYAKFITLTNHTPFELDEEDRSIDPYNSGSSIVNNYFPTVRYLDESIEAFFDHLKESDLYDDSIIVIMGDHDGISAHHNRAMAQYLDEDEITPYDNALLQQVPFIVHIPGHDEGEVISKVTGQVDIKPTLLHLVGIETDNDIYFGNDMFHNDHRGYVAFRNGDFISEEYVYTGGACYEHETGEMIAEPMEVINGDSQCNPIKEKVEQELDYSDEIIYGDLFRFSDFDEAN